LDLGAGTGANVRYLRDRFPTAREWTLLDRDAALLDLCPAVFMGWAEEGCRACREEGWDLELESAGRPVRLRFLPGSLPSMDIRDHSINVDLVTANALFDLVSESQLEAFADWLAGRRLPLLATINYRSMAFAPAAPQDREFVGLYERHMIRPQEFGCAMGPRCAVMMIAALQRRDYVVHAGASDWRLGASDRIVIEYILDFMRGAIVELPAAPRQVEHLNDWIVEKHRLCEAGRLRLQVRHVDLFARPRVLRTAPRPG
jgi:hypothetical protein